MFSAYFNADIQLQNSKNKESYLKIVNIINFVRLYELIDKQTTANVLYETTASQVKMIKNYRLGDTFLLQYDALLNPRYQQLFKDLFGSIFKMEHGRRFLSYL